MTRLSRMHAWRMGCSTLMAILSLLLPPQSTRALAPSSGDPMLYRVMTQSAQLHAPLQKIFAWIQAGETPSYAEVWTIEQIFRQTDDSLRVHYFAGGQGLIVHSLYPATSSLHGFLHIHGAQAAALPPGLLDLAPQPVEHAVTKMPGVFFVQEFALNDSVDDWILREAYGGKAAGLVKLQRLQNEIGGYSVPPFVLIDIHGIKEWLDNVVRSEGMKKIVEYGFTANVPGYIKSILEKIQASDPGMHIVRSSSRSEDSFRQSLAGRYASLEAEPGKLEQKFKGVFSYFLRNLLYSDVTYEEAADQLGIVVQQFIKTDSSGIAFSTLGGVTSIEAVLGDAGSPTEGGASTIIDLEYGKITEILQGFSAEIPLIMRGPYRSALKDKDAQAVWKQCTHEISCGDKKIRSPLSLEQIQEVNALVKRLEKRMGYAVDVEFGYKDNVLFLYQMRPVTGKAELPPPPLPDIPQNTIITKIPVAVNAIDRTLRLVMLEQGPFYNNRTLMAQLINLSRSIGGLGILGYMPDLDFYRANNDAFETELFPVFIDYHMANRISHRGIIVREEGKLGYFGAPRSLEAFKARLTFEPVPDMKGVYLSKEHVRAVSNGMRGIIAKVMPPMSPEEVWKSREWPTLNEEFLSSLKILPRQKILRVGIGVYDFDVAQALMGGDILAIDIDQNQFDAVAKRHNHERLFPEIMTAAGRITYQLQDVSKIGEKIDEGFIAPHSFDHITMDYVAAYASGGIYAHLREPRIHLDWPNICDAFLKLLKKEGGTMLVSLDEKFALEKELGKRKVPFACFGLGYNVHGSFSQMFLIAIGENPLPLLTPYAKEKYAHYLLDRWALYKNESYTVWAPHHENEFFSYRENILSQLVALSEQFGPELSPELLAHIVKVTKESLPTAGMLQANDTGANATNIYL